jgi:hypothetical protein
LPAKAGEPLNFSAAAPITESKKRVGINQRKRAPTHRNPGEIRWQ